MSDLQLCFFLVSATFYLVPEGLLTIRELLGGRPSFWVDFSPKRVRRVVALYRSRFQPDLPTEEGLESSMDGFIPYVPHTKRDRSKPHKDKHLMVDKYMVDRQLSPDNILKDYLDSQAGGISGEQFNFDGLFEFDFPPIEGGSNEVQDFSKAARMVNGVGSHLWTLSAPNLLFLTCLLPMVTSEVPMWRWARPPLWRRFRLLQSKRRLALPTISPFEKN
ncbi:hypothetical protein YC2023_082157 [Brassica napus]